MDLCFTQNLKCDITVYYVFCTYLLVITDNNQNNNKQSFQWNKMNYHLKYQTFLSCKCLLK